MHISDNKTVSELQNQFSQLFPGLKIEFYRTKHKHYEPTLKSELIDPSTKIGDIRTIHTDGYLSICPLMRVVDLENELCKTHGLFVQVSRRSIDIWIQTSITDDWSLAKQNNKALQSVDQNVSLYTKG